MCFELKKMKKLFIFNILVLLFINVSCSKPKHLIVGKWQAVNDEKVIFTFDENNQLITDINGRKITHKFVVNGENTVSFSENLLDDNNTTYNFKIVSSDEFYLKCDYKAVKNGLTRVDSPELCSYSSFKRIQ